MEMLKINQISMTYYTNEGELEVVKDFSLILNEGEILSIVGPSGCGKSTILNILCNLIKPTSGTIDINGEIGYMFQNDNLLEWRTVYQNIIIGLQIKKRYTEKSKEYIEILLKKYHLWEFRNNYPKQLSGGMRQRVALIRTLVLNPAILLLDEPFSALDYQTRLLVNDDIYSIIKNEKKSTILVTHDISEAIAMGDRVIVLDKRPTSVKKEHQIKLTTDGERNPYSSRTSKEFKDYFNAIWKELNNNE